MHACVLNYFKGAAAVEMGFPGVNECVCTHTPLLIPGKAFTILNRFFKKTTKRNYGIPWKGSNYSSEILEYSPSTLICYFQRSFYKSRHQKYLSFLIWIPNQRMIQSERKTEKPLTFASRKSHRPEPVAYLKNPPALLNTHWPTCMDLKTRSPNQAAAPAAVARVTNNPTNQLGPLANPRPKGTRQRARNK